MAHSHGVTGSKSVSDPGKPPKLASAPFPTTYAENLTMTGVSVHWTVFFDVTPRAALSCAIMGIRRSVTAPLQAFVKHLSALC